MSNPKPGTTRYNLDLPEDLHQALAKRAQERGSTMSELLRQYARLGLALDEGKPITIMYGRGLTREVLII